MNALYIIIIWCLTGKEHSYFFIDDNKYDRGDDLLDRADWAKQIILLDKADRIPENWNIRDKHEINMK